MPVKVMRIEDAPVKIMRWNRGKTLRLVDEEDGAKNVDVHINLFNIDSGPGPTDYHAGAENIYIFISQSSSRWNCHLLPFKDLRNWIRAFLK